ncbi:uncharacterized protein MONBRDRAFT_3366, partial [Monosiga brevicollis MX1]
EMVEPNMLKWTAVLEPSEAPFDKGRFTIDITFPRDYPYEPPFIKFITPIYHPHVLENGLVCLPLGDYNWHPSLGISGMLKHILQVINTPERDYILRWDLGKLYDENRQQF